MAEFAFRCCRPLQNLILGVLAKRKHAANLGTLARESACLVEEEGVDLAHQLKRAAILHQDAVLRAKRERGQHAQRCRHADTRAQIAVHHRDGAINADGPRARGRQGPASE